jgi:hypothetical protein
MRVAIVFYGQPRDYIQGYHNIMEFINKQECCSFDFFYHCWKLNEGQYYNHSRWRDIDINTLIFKEDILAELKYLYNPISCEIEHQQDVSFDEALYKDTIAFQNTEEIKIQNINNTLYNIHSKNKARKVLQTYLDNNKEVTYDFVVLTRFDIGIMPDLNLSEADTNNTYISDIHYPRNIISDACIVAPTDIFLKWFTFEKIRDILDNYYLLEELRAFNENFEINIEEIVFAKYIFHYKNMDNIRYFKGGNIQDGLNRLCD